MKLTLFAVSDLLPRNAKIAHNLMQELLLDKHFLNKIKKSNNYAVFLPPICLRIYQVIYSLCVSSNLLIDFLHDV